MAMSNDHTIICTDNNENFIEIINLKAKIVKKITFEFMINNSAPLTIFYFKENRLTCLIECGYDIMHLTYIN
jgi:hypothetical protein